MTPIFRAWDKTSETMMDDYAHVGQFGELYVSQFHSSAYSDSGCPDLMLMMASGLLDKNKTRIFEGDIVKMRIQFPGNEYNDWEDSMDRTYIGQVVILASKGTCLKKPRWFDVSDDGKPRKGQLNWYKPVSGCNSEVIGNIYQNEDLLTKER